MTTTTTTTMKNQSGDEIPYWKDVDDKEKELYKVSYTKVNFFSDEEWNETIFYQTKEQIQELFRMSEKGYTDGMIYEGSGDRIKQIWRNKRYSISLMTDEDKTNYPKNYWGKDGKCERELVMLMGLYHKPQI